jgi:hypothetical protein
MSDDQTLALLILKLFSLEFFSWLWWLIWQLLRYLKLSYKEAVLRYLLNSQLASLKITSLKKQANRSVHMVMPDGSELTAWCLCFQLIHC